MNDVPRVLVILCPDQTSTVSGQQRIQQEAEVGGPDLHQSCSPEHFEALKTLRPFHIMLQCPSPTPGITLLCVTSAPSLSFSQTWDISPKGGEGAKQWKGFMDSNLTL